MDFIAKQTKLTLDGVEFLLMKTLSLHLIEGIIDQVDNTVQVRVIPLSTGSPGSRAVYPFLPAALGSRPFHNPFFFDNVLSPPEVVSS